MKAIRYHKFGGEEELIYEDAPMPIIENDEVLVKVVSTSFNPLDVLIRLGYLNDFLPIELPFIPNVDVAGVVTQVGKNVTTLSVGDNVFGFIDRAKNGAAAEYVATKPEFLALAPNGIELTKMGAVGCSALAAWQGIFDNGKLEKDQRILVIGADGGVGSFAVQFAKNKGAHVIGLASIKEPLIDLGCDEVINYTTETLDEKLLEQVDLIFNTSPLSSEDLTKMLKFIKRDGTFISTTNLPDDNAAKELNITASGMNVMSNNEQLRQMSTQIEQGNLRPYITEQVTLEELPKIHARNGSTRGKIIITVS